MKQHKQRLQPINAILGPKHYKPGHKRQQTGTGEAPANDPGQPKAARNRRKNARFLM